MVKQSRSIDDIRSLVFDGHIKEVVHVGESIIVIRTLSPSDEVYISDNFSNVGNEYSLMAVTETIKRSIHSINGCVIPKDDIARDRVKDWSRIIITNVFKIYLSLGDRVHEAVKSIDEFLKTDASKFKWSSIKNSKSSLGHDLEHNYIQQLWIYMNEQNDIIEQYKHDWQNTEYITDSICTFINPKAMRQIQQRKSEQQSQLENNIHESYADLDLEPEVQVDEQVPEKKVVAEKRDIPIKNEEHTVIQNTTETLFESLKKKPNESKAQHEHRVSQAVQKSMEEDEFDKIIRENDEFHFARNLRIKKENARRIKEHNASKNRSVTIIDDPAPTGIDVGYHIVSSIGDDEESNLRYDESQKDNKFYVNGIDYSEICLTKAYEILKNRDKIFIEVSHETDAETIKWIEYYIDLEDKIGVEDDAPGLGDRQSSLLDRRESAVKGESSAARRQAMIDKLKQEQQGNDEIYIGD